MQGITAREISAFSKYILGISGIYLDQSKGYLLESRFGELIKECKATSYEELLNKIKSDRSHKLEKKLIDAITTNETYFFRDTVPFDLLRNKIVPELIDRRRKEYKSGTIPIKVWSAASSTGQEIYSIAITLSEMLAGMGNFNISILGTDISSAAIAQASYGKYSRFEVERGLSSNLRHKYFNQSGNSWRIKDKIRALATFEKLNLMKPFPVNIGSFDIIFCRNVAIYFQAQDKIKLFKKIASALSPGGSLLVGGSENLFGFAPDFVSQQYLKGVYFSLKKDQSVPPPLQEGSKKKTLKNQYSRPSLTLSKRKAVYDPQPVTTKATKTKPLQSESINSVVPQQILKQEKLEIKKIEKVSSLEEGSSLLESIQNKKGEGITSLLDSKSNKSESKKSLLDHISRQNEID